MPRRFRLLLIALTLAAGASTLAGALGWSDAVGFGFGWLWLVAVLTHRRSGEFLRERADRLALILRDARRWLRQSVTRRFPRFAAALPQVLHGS